MKIYLVRHSKTLWNEQRRLQGHKDSPLTKEGIENAYALKEYLNKEHITFDKVFSSPILRAYSTAMAIADKDDIIQDKRLLEMNFGDYEGQYIKDLLEMKPCYYDYMWNQPHLFDRLPNGESYEEVLTRIDSFFRELISKDYKSVLIVTHGMYMILIFAYILNISKDQLNTINKKVVEGCSLNLVVYENNKLSIEYTNKHDFLPHISHISFNK